MKTKLFKFYMHKYTTERIHKRKQIIKCMGRKSITFHFNFGVFKGYPCKNKQILVATEVSHSICQVCGTGQICVRMVTLESHLTEKCK